MKKICVLGSMNIDYTFSVPYFNQPGESLTAYDMAIYTGGKGGNQAIAAARMGGNVRMIGCLGCDANGDMYREKMAAEGINVSGVVKADIPSGSAFIEVDPSGENRIAVAQGANDMLTPEIVRAAESKIAEADVYLTQLENPMDAIIEGMKLAKKHGATVILDPAPAKPLNNEMISLCDFMTPNETELEILTGMPVETIEQAIVAARRLIARGAKAVINKRGGTGALLITANDAVMYSGFKVNAVDTTAAGDSFNAGFAVGLARELSIPEAIRLANAVGALSTTKAGAQAAMPTQSEVDALMENN